MPGRPRAPVEPTQDAQHYGLTGDVFTFPALVNIQLFPQTCRLADLSESEFLAAQLRKATNVPRPSVKSPISKPSMPPSAERLGQSAYTYGPPDAPTRPANTRKSKDTTQDSQYPMWPFEFISRSVGTTPLQKTSARNCWAQPSTVTPTDWSTARIQLPPPQQIKREQFVVTDKAQYRTLKPLSSFRKSKRERTRLSIVENCETKNLYVEKRLAVVSASDVSRAKAEREALWQIMHACPSNHIAHIIESFHDETSTHGSLILEYCDLGTIEDLIDQYIRERKICPEGFAWHVLAGLASALCMCHYGITNATMLKKALRGWEPLHHLNIRPANVCLTSKHQRCFYPRVVLVGFSCVSTKTAIRSGHSNPTALRSGHAVWLPPEGQASAHENRSSATMGTFTDIWQAGNTVRAMCRRLHHSTPSSRKGGSPCGGRYSVALNTVISCCMHSDYRDRPTAIHLMDKVLKEMSLRGIQWE